MTFGEAVMAYYDTSNTELFNALSSEDKQEFYGLYWQATSGNNTK